MAARFFSTGMSSALRHGRDIASIAELVKRASANAGFDQCGIAPVADFPELARFQEWIADGHAGEMKYLESRDDSGQLRRASALNSIFPWARSVVVCAVNYNTPYPYSIELSRRQKDGSVPRRDPSTALATDFQPRPTLKDEGLEGRPETAPTQLRQQSGGAKLSEEPARGWISRYAWSREDYHDSVLHRLREIEAKLKELCAPQQIETRAYVDTGPIVERVYAKYAGIGWQGKNTCIINQNLGSWLFLGVIVTSLELTPDLPAPDRCGTCTRCIDACPTNAFVAPYQLDSNKCIAYLTIEKRGPIPEEFREAIGHHIFGCDICQDVCPWNRKARTTDKPEFQPREGLVNPALVWLAEISEDEFREKFNGSPIKRTKRSGLRRNALIAVGNSGDRNLIPVVECARADADPLVSEAAQWAEKRLRLLSPAANET
jgi:epoxyqueuosine reductase